MGVSVFRLSKNTSPTAILLSTLRNFEIYFNALTLILSDLGISDAYYVLFLFISCLQ